jgi:tripartite-type tricarboxylate transporter receptor subunit TctC
MMWFIVFDCLHRLIQKALRFLSSQKELTVRRSSSIFVFIALAIVGSLTAPAFVCAQPYPTKPIKLIVPFAPGGTTDLLARVVADKLPRLIGQPVIVDNRAGAGGVIGSEALARSAADGYSIGMATASTHGVNPAVYPKLSYDAIKDFTAIANIATVPNVMVIHPSVPARNLKEFIDLARQQPGQFSFASPGSGSIGHAVGELFKQSARVNLVHIPYKGAGPALNDVIGGQVQVLYDNLPTSLPHIQAGKLRPLAIAALARSRVLPDVPTFAELGLPLVNEPAWFGLVAPATTPPEIVSKLQRAVDTMLRDPDVKLRLEKMGAEAAADTSSVAFAAHIRKQIDDFKLVARTANIRVE